MLLQPVCECHSHASVIPQANWAHVDPLTVMNISLMMEFTNSRNTSCEFPLHLSGLTNAKPETKPPTQTEDSQFQFSQFMKCNFFDLVVAIPDARVDASLQSLMGCHNAKGTNS